jgi:hypothetical protein
MRRVCREVCQFLGVRVEIEQLRRIQFAVDELVLPSRIATNGASEPSAAYSISTGAVRVPPSMEATRLSPSVQGATSSSDAGKRARLA